MVSDDFQVLLSEGIVFSLFSVVLFLVTAACGALGLQFFLFYFLA